MKESTYIRVSPKLLNGGVFKVTGVTEEFASDLVSVGKATINFIGDREIATLPELDARLLTVVMELLDPRVMIGSARVGYMLLELDDVGVGNLLSVG